MTPAEHRQLVLQRASRSEGWRVIHALGSVKLAVVLLLTIAIACAAATVMESSFSTKVARYYIYDAPWFIIWLGLLVANLVCAVVTRWPWQRRHAGFIITHGGIVLLIIGAFIGQRMGFEGTVTLREGGEPARTLVVDETILQVESPVSGMLYETALPVAARRPAPERPRIMPVPESPLRLVVSDYAEDLTVRAQVERDPSGAGPAGMDLVLSTAMMGQSLRVPLALAPVEARSYDMMGRARLEILEKLPRIEGKAPEKRPVYRETHMIFARMPGTPVTHNTLGQSSGHAFFLEAATDGRFRLRHVRPNGTEEIRLLSDVLDKPYTDPDGTIVHVMNYWPDLRMVDGRPVSASDRPDNPAALLTLSGEVADTGGGIPVLQLAPSAGGQIAYQLVRGNQVTGRGVVREGDSFLTGWADWTVTVAAFHPSARIRTVAERAGKGAEAVVPGIRVALQGPDAQMGEPVWIPSGTSRVVEWGQQAVRVGFGLRTRRLNFLVSLEDFEVPRDEGSHEPADFISRVRFDGLDKGEPHRALIRMNHPASYPPQWWQSWLGMNYKFSQAGWDPNALDQTTLQVLHDPGWPLKWLGSLLISVGIFTMFYLKPRASKTKESRPEEATRDLQKEQKL